MANTPLKKLKTKRLNNESLFLNENPDAYLIYEAQEVIALMAKQTAIQASDCNDDLTQSQVIYIRDRALKESQELNKEINSKLYSIAQYHSFTTKGLEAKARVLKVVTGPIGNDEGFINYEASCLVTSLLMDILTGGQ